MKSGLKLQCCVADGNRFLFLIFPGSRGKRGVRGQTVSDVPRQLRRIRTAPVEVKHYKHVWDIRAHDVVRESNRTPFYSPCKHRCTVLSGENCGTFFRDGYEKTKHAISPVIVKKCHSCKLSDHDDCQRTVVSRRIRWDKKTIFIN